MLERAKREIDLPGFLGAHGWWAVRGHDSLNSRCLDGPDGSRLIVSRARDGHWQWFDATGGGGTVVDVCIRLLRLGWGHTMSKLRRALTEPPPPLPVAGRTIAGSRRSGPAPGAPPLENETAHLSEIAPTVEPELQPLGERGRAYLVQHRHLAPETVDASAHNLRQNRYGSVRALHHRQSGNGEERGENWKSFIGNQADGEGRGRSLWICFPTRGCSRLIVAESFVSALSAWELLSVEERMVTGLVSTAGAISSAGAARLGRVLVGCASITLASKRASRSGSMMPATKTRQELRCAPNF